MTTRNNPSTWTMEEVVEVLEQIASSSFDVSGSALIFGCPDAKRLHKKARALLSKIKENADD